MIERVITLKFKTDDKDALASINRLAEAQKRFNNDFSRSSTSRNSGGNQPAAFDISQIKRQFAELQNLSRRETTFAALEFRKQTKAFELEQKNQIQAARLRSSAIEAVKRREYSEFVRLEREKTKEAQASARAQSSSSGRGLTSSVTRGSAVGSFVGNIGANVVSELTSDFVSGAKAVFAYTASLEQARIGFETLTGSAGAAAQHIQDLQNFAKKTPFDFGGLVKASQLLQGVGIESGRIIPILSDVGNALSAAGKGNEEIQRTVLALSQIQSKGKLAGQEINQLAENGISAVSILSQALGKTKAEIISMSEDGQISTELFLTSLHKVIEQNNIGDAMERQSHTFNGALSNIKDALFQFSESAFRPLFAKFATIADELAKEVSKQDADFQSIGKAIGTAIADTMGAAIVASVGAVTEQLGKEFADLFNGKGLGDFTNPGAEVARSALRQSNRVGLIGTSSVPQWLNDAVMGGGPARYINQRLAAEAEAEAKRVELRNAPFAQTDRKNTLFNNFANSSSGKSLVPKGGLIIRQDATTITYLDKVSNTIKTISSLVEKVNKDGGVAGAVTGLGKGKGKGGSKKNPFVEIQDYIREAGFKPGSAQRPGGPNGPTDHANRGAVDTSVNANPGKTIDDYTRLIVGALERGKQVIDERLVGYFPGIKSTGKNVHIGNSNNKSLFLPQSFYSVPVGLLKQLDAKRKERKGLNVDTGELTRDFQKDLAREVSEKSNTDTKAARDSFTRVGLDLYKRLGIIPDSQTASDFGRLLQEDAQKGLNVGFGKGIQPTVEQLNQQFSSTGFGRRGEVAVSPDVKIQKELIETRKTSHDEYLDQIKEELNIRANIDQIIHTTANFQEEVSLRVGGAITQQTLDLLNAQIEFDVFQKQNADETFVAHRRNLTALQENLGLQREIAEIEDERANAGINTELRNRVANLREVAGLEREISDLQNTISNGGANDDLQIQAAHLRDIVELRQRELDAVISINRSELELANSQQVSTNQIRARVLDHLSQQKTLNESIADGITDIYDKAASGIDKLLDKGGIGKIPILGNIIKQQSRNVLGNITRGIMDKFLPPDVAGALQKTGNPVVDTIQESNKYLKKISDSLTKPLSFGAGGGGGGGVGSGGRGGSVGSSGLTADLGAGSASGVINRGGGGGILGTLNQAIFGKEKFGNNVGTYGAFGAGANILGGLIGGRVGGVISGAGTGLALGAKIGSLFGPGPGTAIGAAIGAVGGGIAGLIASIFGKSKLRKAEEKQRAAFLGEARTGIAQFDQLIKDVRALRIDGASAISQGDSLATQIKSQYLSQASALKDKKTRNIALKEIPGIESQIAAKLAELRRAADVSNAAQSRQNRLIPEFARGNFFGRDDQMIDMRRGFINGGQIGVDRHLGLFADGEAILNRQHQANISALAGFDILAHAGIPNYPKGSVTKKYASGNIFGTPPFSPSVPAAAPIVIEPKIIFENVEMRADSRVWFETPDGKRKLVHAINKLKKEGDI